MDKLEKTIVDLNLLGGRLSLDFANTADWHAGDRPVEFLRGYDDLVAWSRRLNILSDYQARRLIADAGRRPPQAEAVLQRAVALREAIFGIFSSITQGELPQLGDIELFNTELSSTLSRSRIVPTAEGVIWDWPGTDESLDWPLRPVVHDALDLLTSPDLRRVRRCEDDRCGWLFLDTSRNRSRRWCSMEDCGNRAKARRHYQRKRKDKK